MIRPLSTVRASDVVNARCCHRCVSNLGHVEVCCYIPCEMLQRHENMARPRPNTMEPGVVLAHVRHIFCFCFSREDYCLQGLQFDTLGGALERLPPRLADLFSPVAFTICLQWLLLQVLLDRVLPGQVSKKPPTACHKCALAGISGTWWCLTRNMPGRRRERPAAYI